MVKLILIAALAACTADAPTQNITNAAFGETCTVVTDTSTECATGVCTDTFDQIGHPVCSEKCTTGNNATCPTGSQGMFCNGKGYCKP